MQVQLSGKDSGHCCSSVHENRGPGAVSVPRSIPARSPNHEEWIGNPISNTLSALSLGLRASSSRVVKRTILCETIPHGIVRDGIAQYGALAPKTRISRTRRVLQVPVSGKGFQGRDGFEADDATTRGFGPLTRGRG